MEKTIIVFASGHIENALKPFLGTEVIWGNVDKWLVCGTFSFPKNKTILGKLYVFGIIRIGIGNGVGYSYRALMLLNDEPDWLLYLV